MCWYVNGICCETLDEARDLADACEQRGEEVRFSIGQPLLRLDLPVQHRNRGASGPHVEGDSAKADRGAA